MVVVLEFLEMTVVVVITVIMLVTVMVEGECGDRC
jgi:hypothetical protein